MVTIGGIFWGVIELLGNQLHEFGEICERTTLTLSHKRSMLTIGRQRLIRPSALQPVATEGPGSRVRAHDAGGALAPRLAHLQPKDLAGLISE